MTMPTRWENGAATGERLHPLKYALTLSEEPLSTAKLTLMPDEPVAVLDFYELFTPTESAGIFRVASIGRDYRTGMRTATLERGECVLGDTLVPGAGTTFSGTMAEAVDELLSYQPTQMWQAGTIEATADVYLQIGEKTILNMLLSMMGSAPNYHLEFDQSAYPWTVNIRANATTPTSEGRLGRNITGCSISYDTSDMCTRVLSDKLTDGHLDSPHINDYAQIFEQTIVLDEAATDAQNIAVAQSYMANRDTPVISIDIDARGLYAVTGVTIDRFRLSQLFRLALPEYGITENQRIIEMTWRDMLANPEAISLVLANRGTDLIVDIARAHKGGGGGRSSAGGKGLEKAESDFRTRIDQTDRYIALTAEQISTQMQAAITVQADRITALVTRQDATEATVSNHSASLIVMANEIAAKVERSDYEVDQQTMEGRISHAESSITQNADQIALRVKKNEVVSEINQTSETIKIQASKIELSGYVTASDLAATNAQITDMLGGDATFTTLRARSTYLGSSSGGNVHIYGQTVRVYSVVDTSGNTHHVFGYT